jgi:predicted Zn-ribbon and HTH transcriptional regulator
MTTFNPKLEKCPDCPECNASWIGTPIPEKSRDFFGGKSHFSRLCGIETDEYDGVSRWQCPDCSAEWNRWTGKRIQP